MSIGTESSIVLHLNSAFASVQLSTGLTTNFIYNLKESVEVPNHEMCQVSLYSATIPYSFYNVNSTNNQFRVTMNDGDDEKTTLYFSGAAILRSLLKDVLVGSWSDSASE